MTDEKMFKWSLAVCGVAIAVFTLGFVAGKRSEPMIRDSYQTNVVYFTNYGVQYLRAYPTNYGKRNEH